MKITLNTTYCKFLSGRLRPQSPWVLRMRNGNVHALYQGPHNAQVKQESFRVFYRDLLRLQEAKYIQSIELENVERRWTGQ